MRKSYDLITNANELLQLHDAAKKEGKLEVGVSKGKRCYIWNEDTKNIQTISPEEAAKRLKLTVDQVHLILESKGDIEFIDDIEKDLAEEAPHQDPIDEIVPVVEEPKAAAPTVEETPVVLESNTPEAKNEQPEEDPKKVLAREIIDDAAGLLLKIRKLYE